MIGVVGKQIEKCWMVVKIVQVRQVRSFWKIISQHSEDNFQDDLHFHFIDDIFKDVATIIFESFHHFVSFVKK